MSRHLISSEYVSPGHPDKIADQISDAILDHYLFFDKNAKVACEVMVKGNRVYVAGEITSTHIYDASMLTHIVRRTICDIGYDSDKYHFNGNTVAVVLNISAQSPEINSAVEVDGEVMAGDQGIMFGYACRETPSMMPLPIYLSRALITLAYNNRHTLKLNPDMKSQVTVEYDGNTATKIDSIVMSMCHSDELSLDDLRKSFMDNIINGPYGLKQNVQEKIAKLITNETKFHINPAGAWHVGGPVSDCGLTGRKIVVDQYGANCEIGGGAFSGKDPSKVDRSAAYMARCIARNALNRFTEANVIKVQLSYAIGEKYPVSVRVWDPTTNLEYPLPGIKLEDLTPTRIIQILELDKQEYLLTAKHGHFGSGTFPWETIVWQ